MFIASVIIIKNRHCEEFSGIFAEIPWQSRLVSDIHKEIAAEHAEFCSIQINLQAGMFLAMTLHLLAIVAEYATYFSILLLDVILYFFLLLAKVGNSG